MKRILALAAATALLVPANASPAASQALVAGEFAVAGGLGTNAQITTGPDGNIWVTVEAGNDVARITPDGAVTLFASAQMSAPVGIIAGPDGNLWVTQAGAVARFAPADPTAATKFDIPELVDPRALAVGSDGRLWTASADKVIAIPPANPGGYTAYAGTGVLGARWIAPATDGTLWVADFGGQQVVNVTTSGVGTKYATGGGPQGVAGGPGGQVAYSNPTAVPQNVGRLTPGGAPLTVDTPIADPFGVTVGADGSYWFALFAANSLGRLTADGSYSTLGGFSAGAGPRQIVAGPGNTLWVVLDAADKVARVTGVSPPTPTPSPTASAGALGTSITSGPAKAVRTSARQAKVTFTFQSSDPRAAFQCRTRAKAKFRACVSPATYSLKKGSYRFQVRAIVDGTKDRTPASLKFKVKRKR